MTNTEAFIKTLKVGDAVWIREYSSWGPSRFSRGKVGAITKTGLIDVSWGHNWGVTVRFNANGRERGTGYHGRSIDAMMPFGERAAEIDQRQRIRAAVDAIGHVVAARDSEHSDEQWCIEEVNRLQLLLNIAAGKVSAISAAIATKEKQEKAS